MGTETTGTAATRAEATNRRSINRSCSNRSNRHGSSEGAAGMGTATTEAAAVGAAPFASLRFRTTVSSYQLINVEPLFYLYSSKYRFFEPVISENHRTCDFRKLSIIDIEPWKMNHIYKKKDNER
jgi:hypothetical protein